ncbi:glycerophosphoryl diester phosphodiesterase membrane domain-containing protein [Oerskovia sp. NPDC060338]|uniref:glycerophosphoryl diester phosphodiesterase membrane domain-containing protein n=1 Tax=Oerskovia sp. NPDC060338 TaxID=3347100 RepID=UPI00364E3C82
MPPAARPTATRPTPARAGAPRPGADDRPDADGTRRPPRDRPQRPALLGPAARTVRAHLPTYLRAVLLLQGTAVLVAVPLMVWLFDLALAAAGAGALTHLNVLRVLSSPVAVILLLVVALVASVVVLFQQGAFLAIGARLRAGEPVSVRAVGADLARTSRKLLGPQLLLFVGYFFVLVPVGNFGTAAFLVRGIAIPEFVVGELLKFDGGVYVYVAFLAGVLYLNLRLVLTLAFLLTSDASVSGSMAASWRATRRLWPRLLGTFAVVALGVVVVAAGIVTLALVPTRVADLAAPGAAPVVAGVTLTLVQVVGFVLVGFVAALLAQVVVAVAGERRELLPDGAAPDGSASSPGQVAGSAELPVSGDADLRDGEEGPIEEAAVGPAIGVVTAAVGSSRTAGSSGSSGRVPPVLGSGWASRPRGVRAAVGLAAVLVLVAVTAANTHAMTTLAREEPGAVIAHRGDPGGGVENSIASLESAAALGADYVELDVLQAADGGLVVFHDLTLRRLAGSDRAVHTMTLDELTSTTIRQGGFEATIPSLEEFVERAQELDVPLLVELKAHGHETPTFVADVVALLRAHGVADQYLVQSIYPEQADEVHALGPEIAVGYVVPFLRGQLGVLPVDFVAIEQSSDSSRVRAEARAAGIDVYVWTVNDPAAMRSQLRGGVDGIITSSPRRAVAERTAVRDDLALSARLEDKLRDALAW